MHDELVRGSAGRVRNEGVVSGSFLLLRLLVFLGLVLLVLLLIINQLLKFNLTININGVYLVIILFKFLAA